MATDLEGFVSSDGRDDKIAEVRRRIDAEGITYIYYQFISVTGRIMGKGVPAPHWESMAQKGFQLVYGSTANLFTDRHGEYIGYGPEAWELVGVPAGDHRSGLRNLQERAEALGGAVRLERNQPHGTVLELRVPLAQPRS